MTAKLLLLFCYIVRTCTQHNSRNNRTGTDWHSDTSTLLRRWDAITDYRSLLAVVGVTVIISAAEFYADWRRYWKYYTRAKPSLPHTLFLVAVIHASRPAAALVRERAAFLICSPVGVGDSRRVIPDGDDVV